MNGDETRRGGGSALVDSAEELIREDGADGWTLADLAARAGVGLDDVTREFGSEWDAFISVIERDEQNFEAVFEDSKDAPARERIVAVLEATVPDFDWSFWIELWSLSLRDERANEFRLKLDRRFRGFIEAIVEDGISAGEFAVENPRQVAITISTLIDAMATNATLGDSTVRPNYMLDACATVASEILGTDLVLPRLEGWDG